MFQERRSRERRSLPLLLEFRSPVAELRVRRPVFTREYYARQSNRERHSTNQQNDSGTPHIQAGEGEAFFFQRRDRVNEEPAKRAEKIDGRTNEEGELPVTMKMKIGIKIRRAAKALLETATIL